MSETKRGAPTAAERAYAEQFLPGAVRIHPPVGPQRLEMKNKITSIPIPKEALQENQGQSPMDYLDHDEVAAVAVSVSMANGRVPRYSDIPSFRAPPKKLSRPGFVPARMHYTILSDPKWAPPEEVKPKPMDVSTAEIVEKPLRKNATREALEQQLALREQEPDVHDSRFQHLFKMKRHFVAYDDNDMFAYTTKQIPLPPYDARMPSFFEVVKDGQIFVTRNKLLVVSYDRKYAVHIPMQNDKLTVDGWSMHTLRGPAPPPGTALVVFSDEWLVGLNEIRCYCLTVEGWAWRRAIMPDMEPISPDILDLVDEGTVYVRNSKASRHLLVYFGWDDLDQEDVGFLYEGLDLDLRRGRLNFPKPVRRHIMRTLPSAEPIRIIPCAGGVALSLFADHTWIFLFDNVARSYLPHARIDFVAPHPVVLPSHIYFLAEHPAAKGSTTVCARMVRSREKEFAVDSFPNPDDVTISCRTELIACAGAMPESYSGTGQTAVVISDDWRSAVVVEFDRRQKMLKLHGGSPKAKPKVTVTMMTPGT